MSYIGSSQNNALQSLSYYRHHGMQLFQDSFQNVSSMRQKSQNPLHQIVEQIGRNTTKDLPVLISSKFQAILKRLQPLRKQNKCMTFKSFIKIGKRKINARGHKASNTYNQIAILFLFLYLRLELLLDVDQIVKIYEQLRKYLINRFEDLKKQPQTKGGAKQLQKIQKYLQLIKQEHIRGHILFDYDQLQLLCNSFYVKRQQHHLQLIMKRIKQILEEREQIITKIKQKQQQSHFQPFKQQIEIERNHNEHSFNLDDSCLSQWLHMKNEEPYELRSLSSNKQPNNIQLQEVDELLRRNSSYNQLDNN